MRTFLNTILCLLASLAWWPTPSAFAHEHALPAGQDDRRSAIILGKHLEEPAVRQAIEAIAHNYLVEIKSIFKQTCFDCHTNLTQYPWYYTVPGIKDKIDADIEVARESIDFSNDYPFLSNNYLTDDLRAIARSMKQKTMPPLGYTILHWKKNLAEHQRQKIILWVEDSLMLLGHAGYLSVAHDHLASPPP